MSPRRATSQFSSPNNAYEGQHLSQRRTITQSAATPGRWQSAACLGLILLTTFIVYLPAIHGGLLPDDPANLTRLDLQSLGGLYRIWFEPGATAQYYPLVHTSFWLEHKLWGYSFSGYHLANVFWHSLSVVLVYLIVTKLKAPGALLAAAIFAVHPVLVESVGWMTEQKNTLSTVFYLSSLLAYLEFDESRRRSHYFLALALFTLALLAKTATVTLPVAILVISWWKRGRLAWRRDIGPLVPFFLLSVASGLMTVWVERRFVGAQGAAFELSYLQRILLAGRAVWFYLGKLVWPFDLSFTYVRWTIDPSQWWQWIFPIAVIITTFALWAIRSRWRGPLAGWLFFCGTLFPVLGLVSLYMFLYTFVADHLQYLASLGIIVVISAGIAQSMKRVSIQTRGAGVMLCVLLVATLAALSWRQADLYGDAVQLHQNTLAQNPNCWIAHHNLGSELQAIGKPEEAIKHYQSTIELQPDFAMSYNNLGNALMQIGRSQEATTALRRAAELKPGSGQIHVNLAGAFVTIGKLTDGIEQFQLALACNPDDAGSHANLANLLSATGNANEAIAHHEESIKLQPDRADFQANYANSLQQLGRSKEAIVHYRLALKLNADDLHVYAKLAESLAASNQSQEAIAIAEKALEIARSTGQAAAVAEFEEWLAHYRIELQRAAESAPLK
jgi:tetratricopeptide (TPR) repeat protein